MLLELFQTDKHLIGSVTEGSDLLVLLDDHRVRYGSHEREVLLDSREVILRR